MYWVIFLYVIPAWVTSLVLLDVYWDRKLQRPNFTYYMCVVFAASLTPLLNLLGPLYLLSKLEEVWNRLWDSKPEPVHVSEEEVSQCLYDVQRRIREQRDPNVSWLEDRRMKKTMDINGDLT